MKRFWPWPALSYAGTMRRWSSRGYSITADWNGNSPLGALAHLQIGRAYALSGDPAKARAAYQDFFALWKDADPDIPILKQAKAEYAKLQ
jgi:hypothetical protein